MNPEVLIYFGFPFEDLPEFFSIRAMNSPAIKHPTAITSPVSSQMNIGFPIG
jgi:hypothetical protein